MWAGLSSERPVLTQGPVRTPLGCLPPSQW
jgi:hypothetical protein